MNWTLHHPMLILAGTTVVGLVGWVTGRFLPDPLKDAS